VQGRRAQGEVRYLKLLYKYQIPNTQNCYSFIGIIVSPDAESGLVITLGKPGRA
jgi:hypothetical protein